MSHGGQLDVPHILGRCIALGMHYLTSEIVALSGTTVLADVENLK